MNPATPVSGRPVPDEIPEGAYGDDGRPRFFASAAMDRMMAAFLDLASETWVLREQIITLEDIISAGGVPREAIAGHKPDAASLARREAERDAFIRRVLGRLREQR